MSVERPKPHPLPLFWGVVAGVCIFVGVNVAIGAELVPTREGVRRQHYTHADPMGGVIREAPAGTAVVATGPAAVYQRVCASCHQADGKGMTGAFPPLAGSEWVNGDPETPIRIALLGLKGPITVAGVTLNQSMPKPPGLTDQDIADVLTYVRESFGNQAPAVTLEMVQAVKASLGGRTDQWTADELLALRAPAGVPEAAVPPDAGGVPTEGEPAPSDDAVPANEGGEAPAEDEAAE